MNPRTRNLALAAGAVIVVGFVGVNTLIAPAAPSPDVGVAAAPSPSGGAPLANEPVAAESPAGTGTVATPLASTSPLGGSGVAVDDAGTGRRSYAIGLHDLAGLPPDAAPGERIELWVTWESPLTRGPRLEKLIGDVVLERIVPGTVPEAPVAVLLSVPAEKVSDLIYADSFGRLSVVLP